MTPFEQLAYVPNGLNIGAIEAIGSRLSYIGYSMPIVGDALRDGILFQFASGPGNFKALSPVDERYDAAGNHGCPVMSS